jgi:UDP-N-acetylglucosamine transferase subunit ALG13
MKKVFVTVGSQEFQFNRLLKSIDDFLVTNKDFLFFGQIGSCTYLPKNFKFTSFISREDFCKRVSDADLIVTHAGTGAIIGALKKHKPVIAFARLSKYHEHVDNHQTEILATFIKKGYILGSTDTQDLGKLIILSSTFHFAPFVSNTQNFVEKIEQLISL